MNSFKNVNSPTSLIVYLQLLIPNYALKGAQSPESASRRLTLGVCGSTLISSSFTKILMLTGIHLLSIYSASSLPSALATATRIIVWTSMAYHLVYGAGRMIWLSSYLKKEELPEKKEKSSIKASRIADFFSLSFKLSLFCLLFLGTLKSQKMSFISKAISISLIAFNTIAFLHEVHHYCIPENSSIKNEWKTWKARMSSRIRFIFRTGSHQKAPSFEDTTFFRGRSKMNTITRFVKNYYQSKKGAMNLMNGFNKISKG